VVEMRKIYRIVNKVETFSLSEEEEEAAVADCMKKNVECLLDCIKEASELKQKGVILADESALSVALALFDKQGTQSFSALTAAIDKKIVAKVESSNRR
jgi:inosine/xanthosine triphosphate pyrophosphatase family protein